jgi:hypothetical protein
MQPGSSANPNPNANAIRAIQDVYEKIHKKEHDNNDETLRDPHNILHLLKSMRSRL